MMMCALALVCSGRRTPAIASRLPGPTCGPWWTARTFTSEEVEKYYRTRVNPQGQPPSQEEALTLELNILEELINNQILLERATKLNLVATDGEVEDKFTELPRVPSPRMNSSAS